jgi:hypothetical protein
VIVHELYVRRPFIGPAKAKAVLVIDPNTMPSEVMDIREFKALSPQNSANLISYGNATRQELERMQRMEGLAFHWKAWAQDRLAR